MLGDTITENSDNNNTCSANKLSTIKTASCSSTTSTWHYNKNNNTTPSCADHTAANTTNTTTNTTAYEYTSNTTIDNSVLISDYPTNNKPYATNMQQPLLLQLEYEEEKEVGLLETNIDADGDPTSDPASAGPHSFLVDTRMSNNEAQTKLSPLPHSMSIQSQNNEHGHKTTITTPESEAVRPEAIIAANEPFLSPSSPIQNTSLYSLQKEFDMEHSITLDDISSNLLIDEGTLLQNADININTMNSNINNTREMKANNNNTGAGGILINDILNNYNSNDSSSYHDFDSSYISFPSSGRVSNAPSIVSNATSFATTSLTVSTAFSQRSQQQRRRRPRPWDNNNDSNNGEDQNMHHGDNNNNNQEEHQQQQKQHHQGESTPLLPAVTSLHSVKTCKRDNTNKFFAMGQNYDVVNDDNKNMNVGKNHASNRNMHHHHHREHHIFKDCELHHSLPTSDLYGTMNHDTVYSHGTYYNQNSQPHQHHHDNNVHNQKSYPFFSSSRTFFHEHFQSILNPTTTIITYLTITHFILMALYNSFIHYQSHRLGKNEYDNAGILPPYWISNAGRVYNPAIGPNVQTLILFGAFHPFLVVGNDDQEMDDDAYDAYSNSFHRFGSGGGDWWRFGIASFCCTSVIQVICNLFILGFIRGMEESRLGSWNVLTVYLLSVLSGGLISIAMAYLQQEQEELEHGVVFMYNDAIQVTGLSCAGIMGILSLILTRILLIGDTACELETEVNYERSTNNADSISGNGTASSCSCIKKLIPCSFNGSGSSSGNRFHFSSLFQWGFPQLGFMLEILNGLFIPFTSLSSILGGSLMGISCGLFLLSSPSSRGNHLYKEWNDNESQTSSVTSDLDDAFNPTITTPTRERGGIPPPPSSPSSSSKDGGLDTPIMRRSILKSPDDEDDDIDVLQSLNAPGFSSGGLKQRNVASKQSHHHRTAFSSNHIGHHHESSDMIYTSKQTEYARMGLNCTTSRGWLRVIGMLMVLSILTIPVLIIGFVVQPLDEQAVLDSMYGCKTLYGVYQYTTATDDNKADYDNGDVKEEINDALNGEIVCAQVCVPLSLLRTVRHADEGTNLHSGTCSHLGYECLMTNNSFDVSKFEIYRDIYVEGSCSSSAQENDRVN